MNMIVNDETVSTAATTVDALLTEVLEEVPTGTAVAVDGEVVPRSAWESQQLREGSRVDILTAVQGG